MALKDSMGRLATTGALYIYTTFTDPAYGTMAFYLGDQRFLATNVPGGAPVYPVVSNWGTLRSVLFGAGDASELSIEMLANAVACPSNISDTRFKVYELFQKLAIRDKAMTVYQWNENESTQEVVWSGFWIGVADSSFNGVQTLTIRARDNSRASIVTYGETIDAATYTGAPPESIGRMIDRAYGDMKTTLATSATLHPGILGYQVAGVPGVVTDTNPSGSSTYTRYLFSKGDGTSNASGTVTTEDLESASPTAGDLFVYLSEIGAFAVPDGTTAISSTTTDSASMRYDLLNSPTLYVALRPTKVTSITTGGVSDSSNAKYLIDDDATNSISLPNTSDEVKYELPSIDLPGVTVEAVYVVIDSQGASSSAPVYKFGIWDPQANASPTWWGGATKVATTGVQDATRRQNSTSSTAWSGTAKYTKTNAAAGGYSDTSAQFQAGRFVSTDSSGIEKPLNIKVIRDGSGGSGALTIFGVSAIVKLTYPKIDIGHRPYIYVTGGLGGPVGSTPYGTGWDLFKKKGDLYDQGGQIVGGGDTRYGAATETPGLSTVTQLAWQKDDGSGTYTGSASSTIKKAPDILAHMLGKVSGLTINSTSGTLGNFVDGRTEDTAGDKSIACSFGNDPIIVSEATARIQSRWPGRVFEDRGTQLYIGDDMNPDPSRLYRASGDVVKISAKKHIVGDIRIQESDPRGIVNKVIFNYGHSFGTNRPQGTTTYDNEVSQTYFGDSIPLTVDEPWVLKSKLTDSTPAAATFLAQWYGRRNSLPRTVVQLQLHQGFYDLRRGHVVQFDEDVESLGIHFPGWRAGKMLHVFTRTDVASTDQADNTTPNFLPAGITSRFAFCTRYQPNNIWLNVTNSSTYTQVNNGWKYYGPSFAGTSFGNVTASDAGDPDTVFGRIATNKISWDRPTCTSWKKTEQTIGSDTWGPGYWGGLEYTSTIDTATGSAEIYYDAKWADVVWEVLEASRARGSVGRYPTMNVTLREMM